MGTLFGNESSCLKKVFLETHNIQNLHSGFGQFNLNLAKSLSDESEFLTEHEVTLNCNNTDAKREIGKNLRYNTYHQITRYPFFRIKRKFNLWHSVNQNTKIEPFSDQIPYLLTIHDINFMEEDNGKRLDTRIQLFKEKLNRSTALVYISEFTKHQTHQYFDVPKVPEYVIYNGNPITNNSLSITDMAAKKNESLRPFIFCIGHVDEKKNFHTLVEMIKHLKGINLIIAGGAKSEYAEKLKLKIKKDKLENRVFLAGHISEVDKIFYYKNCMAFAFPSLREGFGLPVIEAMTFGKPVFLSNLSSLPEIGGQHSFYWENFDPKYMANLFEEGMSKYEDDQEKYSSIYAERAKSFSWTKAAKEYIEVYKSILEASPI
ncbi:glycosyltransferase family 4 protein [Zunongwangia endophytica]|uniref:Glycosyltransferase family 4 protein n=1 Tax=Zunongwangia endophytica TaxID=1808945 RepID=A0ABV8H9D8_9FLAO|nr:glycosyltransferase family 1 protein [Zunongwangia endophytica]MDN3593519.1 glycosyltransferase family 1 protein [Zunongwangia endophytica]